MTKSPRAGLLAGPAPARVRHAPRSSHANDWRIVSEISAQLGITLDEWQDDVLQAAMGVRMDGRWATPQIAVSAPRQNGKSQLIVARALAGVLAFDERTIVISAHQQDTAREVFSKITDLIEANPALESRISGVIGALNRERIRFKGGQEIKFKTRSKSGGRGFSSDCLLLDEAQILPPQAWAAILPTMSARPNPQVWLLGTPPTPDDDGEVFGRFRELGIAGKESRLAYLEWSAQPSDNLDSEETWRKANPSYGLRIDFDAVAGERSTMSDDQFALERLGIWESIGAGGVIPYDLWKSQGDPLSVPADRWALGVEVGPDARWASVSLAGQRADGTWHVELDTQAEGSNWVVPLTVGLLQANPMIRAVVADAGSPTRVLLDEFQRVNVHVMTPTVRELGVAHTRMLEGVVTGQVWHTAQQQINTAVGVAGSRPLGDTGMWVFSRKTAASDITPIQSATLALWGAQNSSVKRPKRSVSKPKVVVMRD